MNRPWPLRLLYGTNLASVVLFLVLLLAYSQAGVSIIWLFVTVYGGGAIGATWLVLLLASHSVRSARLSLRIIPVASVLLAAAMLTLSQPPNALFRARFELSRSRLTAAAVHCRTHPKCAPTWIGLFPVTRSHVEADQVRFITTQCGVFDFCGVVYAPSTQPRQLFEDYYSSLGDGWYHVYEGF
jgi:hypothetical protein